MYLIGMIYKMFTTMNYFKTFTFVKTDLQNILRNVYSIHEISGW